MGKPHKHAELIKAWADGARIQYKPAGRAAWHDWDEIYCPSFHEEREYRIKPELEYPKSSLSDYELECCHHPDDKVEIARRKIADAAVARYCQEQEKQNA